MYWETAGITEEEDILTFAEKIAQMTNFKLTLTFKSLASVMASLYKTLEQNQTRITSPEQSKERERG